MRVAYFTSWNNKCGISEYVRYLISHLKGVEPTIVSPPIGEGQGVRLDEEFVYRYEPTDFPKLTGLDVDLIHAHFEYGIFGCPLDFMRILKEVRKQFPVIVTFHTFDEKMAEESSLYADCYDAAIIHNRFSLPEGTYIPRSIEIPHGILEREVFPMPGILGKPIISTFGFLSVEKNFHLLIDAMKYLKRDPSFEDPLLLLLISPSFFTPAFSSYYPKIRERILASSGRVVVVLDWEMERKLSMIAASDLFVTPLREGTLHQGGTSGAGLWGFACKKPTLTSVFPMNYQISPFSEVIQSPLSAETVAESIGRVWKRESFRDHLKEESMRARSLFSWKKVAAYTKEVYENVLSGKESPDYNSDQGRMEDFPETLQ